MKMRILFIITGLSVGGAERQVCDLADVLADKGHELSILSLTGISHTLPTSRHVAVHELKLDKSLPSLFAGLVKSIRIIRAIKPNVVHSHMVHANIFARLVRFSFPLAPLVCTAHSENEGGLFRTFAYRITDWLSDLNTNVSHKAVDVYINKRISPPSKIKCVYNGINVARLRESSVVPEDLRCKLGISPHTHVFLFLGRLVKQKNVSDILRAFAIVSSSIKSHLVIVGDGPLQSQLSAEVRHLGLADQVTFCGSQENVGDWFRMSDTFVLASLCEGFGLVVGEAMACGTLVVANDVGGVSEVLGRDIGWLVPVGDTHLFSASMSEAAMLDSETKQTKLRNGSCRIGALFDLNHISDTWLDIYEQYV
jgi:glycosyltransferase involved in cell wall biosynthesis